MKFGLILRALLQRHPLELGIGVVLGCWINLNVRPLSIPVDHSVSQIRPTEIAGTSTASLVELAPAAIQRLQEAELWPPSLSRDRVQLALASLMTEGTTLSWDDLQAVTSDSGTLKVIQEEWLTLLAKLQPEKAWEYGKTQGKQSEAFRAIAVTHPEKALAMATALPRNAAHQVISKESLSKWYESDPQRAVELVKEYARWSSRLNDDADEGVAAAGDEISPSRALAMVNEGLFGAKWKAADVMKVLVQLPEQMRANEGFRYAMGRANENFDDALSIIPHSAHNAKEYQLAWNLGHKAINQSNSEQLMKVLDFLPSETTQRHLIEVFKKRASPGNVVKLNELLANRPQRVKEE